MSIPKIGYFADGPWSHQAFKLLNEDTHIEICYIFHRIDTKNDTLKSYADKHNIGYLTSVKVNSTEFYALAQGYECDLFVSMSFNRIFKKKTINLPKLRTKTLV